MRPVVLISLAALILSGCAAGPGVDYVSQIQAEKDTLSAKRQAAAERVKADREAYIKAHPESRFKDAIAEGYIHLGMSPEEVEAAGYDCQQKETSAIGHVDECRRVDLQMQASDDSVVPAEYVGYNSDDRVDTIGHG